MKLLEKKAREFAENLTPWANERAYMSVSYQAGWRACREALAAAFMEKNLAITDGQDAMVRLNQWVRWPTKDLDLDTFGDEEVNRVVETMEREAKEGAFYMDHFKDALRYAIDPGFFPEWSKSKHVKPDPHDLPWVDAVTGVE